MGPEGSIRGAPSEGGTEYYDPDLREWLLALQRPLPSHDDSMVEQLYSRLDSMGMQSWSALASWNQEELHDQWNRRDEYAARQIAGPGEARVLLDHASQQARFRLWGAS